MVDHDELGMESELSHRESAKHTEQHKDVPLRLVQQDEQVLAIEAVLAADAVRLQKEMETNLILTAVAESKDLELAERTAHLALSALELSHRTNQLHESNRYLLAKTAQLEEVNAELKTLMQQREDFVAALTHDLKNPLIASTRILESMANGAIQADQQPVLVTRLIDANKSMLRMIWNLLETYRFDCGCLVPQRELIDTSLLLEQCLGEFTAATSQKKITVSFEIAEGCHSLISDRILLRRVLVNLLDNAIKFTPENGQVDVSVHCVGEDVQIRVKDSGTGMANDQVLRLFERFSQTKQGRDYAAGSGLGLFVSKQIMAALSGRIECFSTPGLGTTFVVTLYADVTRDAVASIA